MKNIAILLAFLLSCTYVVHAQKTYATKTAQIKFLSKTPAEDIEAVNNQVESRLVDKSGQMTFALLIKGFKFENELMQDHFNKPDYMDSDKYPKATFKGVITNIATVNFAKDGAYPVMVDGDLTIRGVTQKTKAAGLIIIEKGKVISKSSFKIKLKQFGLTGKDIGTVIANDMEITVSAKYE